MNPDYPIPLQTLDASGDSRPPVQGGFPGPSPAPQVNPLIIDPFLETTPPPGNPKDKFGIGTTPEYREFGSLQSGQTLIIYHPFAEHAPEIIDTVNLASTREPHDSPPSQDPWAPFKTHADFEQAELFLHHNCTDPMINDQLQLNQSVPSGAQTMKNAREMHKILAEAGQHQDTSPVGLSYLLQCSHGAHWEVKFRSVEISVPYSHGVKSEDRTYTIFFRPAMKAILDLIEDPGLYPPFIFYPERHYVLNPQTKQLMRVWTDIHTGDDWWELQVHFYILQ